MNDATQQSEPYQKEHLVACLAVQRAVIATKKVLASLDKGVLSKADTSPVSLADFAAQALIVSAFRKNFPQDAIIGEESADELRRNPDLAAKVWDLVQSTRLDNEEHEALLSRPESLDDVLDAIDLGTSARSISALSSGRCWTIDPVDGTKMFLQGTQYCCVTSLIDRGVDQVAAIACPHVHFPSSGQRLNMTEEEGGVDRQGGGILISAVRGHGAFVRPLASDTLREPTRVSRREKDKTLTPGELVFSEAVTQTQTARFDDRHLFAEKLGAAWPPINIYCTQLKYIACALGASDVYIRAVKDNSSPPSIWDHSGGILIFQESGGKVTDLTGKPLILSAGKQLTENFGVVAAPETLHDTVLQVVKDVMGSRKEYAQYFG